MKKICILCASEFEAKRSDANYCSEQCRAKANYRKRKSNTENTITTHFNTAIVKGEITFKEIQHAIEKAEHEIETTNVCIESLKQDIMHKRTENAHFSKQTIELKDNKIRKMQKTLELADVYIYNNYLNSKYINASKVNDPKMFDFYKSDMDIEGYSGKAFRIQIRNFKTQLKRKIVNLESEYLELKNQIDQNEIIIQSHTVTIKEKTHDLRFYQSRIIRYESLLIGK